MRITRKMSRKDVAEKIGVSTTNYSELERGKIALKFEHIVLLVLVFDVDLRSFFKCLTLDVSSKLNPIKREPQSLEIAELETRIELLEEQNAVLEDALGDKLILIELLKKRNKRQDVIRRAKAS